MHWLRKETLFLRASTLTCQQSDIDAFTNGLYNEETTLIGLDVRGLAGGWIQFHDVSYIRPSTSTMARNRKEKDLKKIKLAQPDRSGPDPTQQTLLDIAQQRGLLKTQDNGTGDGSQEVDGDEEPLVGRLGETFLWSISLTMLHFTLDVLVAHQYAVAIEWNDIVSRSVQAFPGSFLFSISSLYTLPFSYNKISI